jgi:hypothetical protein
VRPVLLLALLPAGVALAVMAAAPLALPAPAAGEATTGPVVLSASVGPDPASAVWDSKAGAAILTATGIRPGASTNPAQGQVVIGNVVAPNAIGLQETSVTHACPASRSGCASGTPGAGQGNLATDLGLRITDTTTGQLVFDGRFDGSGGAAPGSSSLAGAVAICGVGATTKKPCPAWTKGEQHTFSFVVAFPSTAGAAGRDNPYQGTSASATFLWGNL